MGYWIGTGSVGHPLLEGIDWLPVAHSEPSLLEGALAVWANNLLIDESGNPTNARYAEERAAMFIRRYCTGVPPEPPMESWEVELW